MPRTGLHEHAIVRRVAQIVDAVMDIDADALERVVQRAHECDIHQIEDPPEPFSVSRQAMRMLLHFRCHLEAALRGRRKR